MRVTHGVLPKSIMAALPLGAVAAHLPSGSCQIVSGTVDGHGDPTSAGAAVVGASITGELGDADTTVTAFLARQAVSCNRRDNEVQP